MALCKTCKEEEAVDQGLCQNCLNGDVDLGDILGAGAFANVDTSKASVKNIRYVRNELLCYAVKYIEAVSPDSLIDVIWRFYSPKEVHDAKQILWEIYDDHLEKMKRSNRKGYTVTKSDVEDIVLQGIQPLANKNILASSDVVFCAVDISRIPKFSPEEVSIATAMSYIMELKAEMKDIRQQLSDNRRAEYSRPQPSARHFQSSRDPDDDRDQAAEVTGLSLNRASSQVPGEPSLPPRSSQGNQMMYSEVTQRRGSTPYQVQHPELLQQSGWSHQQRVAPLSPQRQSVKPANEKNEWKVQRRKQIREKAKDMQVVVGNKETGLISCAAEKMDLFVFNVEHNWLEKDLTDEMTQNGVVPLRLRCVSNERAEKKSFKVSVKKDDYEKVMCSTFWKFGVKCREWFTV